MTPIVSNATAFRNPQNADFGHIIQSFQHLKHSGNGYRAQCPCCSSIGKDKSKSNLYIQEKTNSNGLPRLSLYCHAGCDGADIVAAVGYELKDLYTNEKQESHKAQAFRAIKEARADLPAQDVDPQFFLDIAQSKLDRGDVLSPEEQAKVEQYRTYLKKEEIVNFFNADKDERLAAASLNLNVGEIHRTVFNKAFGDKLFNTQIDFETIYDVAADSTRQSFFIQSPLGSGKTELAHKMATTLDAPIIFVSFLRSVVAQNRHSLQAALNQRPTGKRLVAHYEDIEKDRPAAELAAVCTTMQGLDREWIKDFIYEAFASGKKPLLIIDEFSQCAQALSVTGGVMKEGLRTGLIDFMMKFKARGGQILALDGNVRPSAAALASNLNLNLFTNRWTPFAAPTLQFTETGQRQPEVRKAMLCLNAGEKVVIACNAKDRSDIVFEAIKKQMSGTKRILLLNIETVARAEQKAFIADPETEIHNYDLIIYSPVLAAGFSVKNTQVRAIASVIEFPKDRFCPSAVEQLIRRFRNLHDNQIDIFFRGNPGGKRVKVTEVPSFAEKLLADAANADAPNFFKSNYLLETIAAQMAIAEAQTEALIDKDYRAALLGHFEAAGYQVVLVDDEISEEQAKLEAAELKEIKRKLAEKEIQRVYEAVLISNEDAAHLERLDEADLPENRALLERRRIENSLAVIPSDYDESGRLPLDLIVEAKKNNLEGKVKRQILALASDFSLPISFIDSDKDRAAVDMKHTEEQIQIFNELLTAVGGSFDGKKAVQIAYEFSKKIVVKRHDLLTCPPHLKTADSVAGAYYREGLITLEQFEAKFSKQDHSNDRRNATRWLSDLLKSFGLKIECKRTKVSGSSHREYFISLDELVNKFVVRRLNKLVASAKAFGLLDFTPELDDEECAPSYEIPVDYYD